MNEAEKWAAELAKSEGEAFEKALSQAKESDIATENRELRALLRAIRNFSGAFEWWDELYGEDAMRLLGGEDDEHN